MREALTENELSIELDIDYLLNHSSYSDTNSTSLPGLILLDLHIPKKGGMEALQEIKTHPKLKAKLKPILVTGLTTSSCEEDIYNTYNLGVNSFIIKLLNFTCWLEIFTT
ncbi:MAG TPA: response regulator [Nostocaceae cyanobacterium]|nr:response regulator [Nostocaceae cyanobacterium]